MNSNENAYEKRYQSGYGVIYPEGYVIRLYESILKYELNFTSGKMLDFGCGNGTHMNYFEQKGFDVFGLDISNNALLNATKLYPNLNNKLKKINKSQSLSEIYKNEKFDFIFSNQTLYYMERDEIKRYLEEMNKLLNLNGLVYFTMMGKEHYLYQYSTAIPGKSMRKVNQTERVSHDTEITFINDKNDLLDLFSLFEPYFVGSYDISMREGSRFHYAFLGRKTN